jgi:mono/diheme cytochrome c family protein
MLPLPMAAAQRDLTEAIARLPAAEIYANRGRVAEAQGRTAEAIDDFRKALLRDPSLVQAKDALTRLGAIAATPSEKTDQRIRQGRALANKNCGRCHAVGLRDSSPKKEAPRVSKS